MLGTWTWWWRWWWCVFSANLSWVHSHITSHHPKLNPRRWTLEYKQRVCCASLWVKGQESNAFRRRKKRLISWGTPHSTPPASQAGRTMTMTKEKIYCTFIILYTYSLYLCMCVRVSWVIHREHFSGKWWMDMETPLEWLVGWLDGWI